MRSSNPKSAQVGGKPGGAGGAEESADTGGANHLGRRAGEEPGSEEMEADPGACDPTLQVRAVSAQPCGFLGNGGSEEKQPEGDQAEAQNPIDTIASPCTPEHAVRGFKLRRQNAFTFDAFGVYEEVQAVGDAEDQRAGGASQVEIKECSLPPKLLFLLLVV